LALTNSRGLSSAGASLNESPPRRAKVSLNFLTPFLAFTLQQGHLYGTLYHFPLVTLRLHRHINPFTTNGAL